MGKKLAIHMSKHSITHLKYYVIITAITRTLRDYYAVCVLTFILFKTYTRS